MKFIIASNNEHKVKEFKRILEPLGIEVASLKEVNIQIDVEETGKTFAENAFLKADAVCKIAKCPVISDDSGLCVECLNNEPGVFSARYAGENATDKQNNEKLLYEMKNVPLKKRTASFVCSICCCFPNGDFLTAEGKCDGYIGFNPEGENGFGYDVLFHKDGYGCFGLISGDQKDKISHRGKALEVFALKLKNKIDSKEEN